MVILTVSAPFLMIYSPGVQGMQPCSTKEDLCCHTEDSVRMRKTDWL